MLNPENAVHSPEIEMIYIKVGGCKCTRPSYFSYEIEIGNPYAILFTARAMRETFLAEVFL